MSIEVIHPAFHKQKETLEGKKLLLFLTRLALRHEAVNPHMSELCSELRRIGFKELGEGCSRRTYGRGKLPFVVKFNYSSWNQNEGEARVAKLPGFEEWFNPCLAALGSKKTLLLSATLKPADEEGMEKTLGVPVSVFNTLQSCLWELHTNSFDKDIAEYQESFDEAKKEGNGKRIADHLRRLLRAKDSKKETELKLLAYTEAFPQAARVITFIKACHEAGIPTRDWDRECNWGVTADGRTVIADYGLPSESQ